MVAKNIWEDTVILQVLWLLRVALNFASCLVAEGSLNSVFGPSSKVHCLELLITFISSTQIKGENCKKTEIKT